MGRYASPPPRHAIPKTAIEFLHPTRNRQLSRRDLQSAEEGWEEFWAATRPVEFTEALARHAGSLARTYRLRGADAVHLASALVIDDPQIVMATWDQRLRDGARAARLRVAPAQNRT